MKCHVLDDCGDHVIVINTAEIALPGDEWKKRVYFHHTGYPGGATWTLAWELHEKDPTMVHILFLKLNYNLISIQFFRFSKRQCTIVWMEIYKGDIQCKGFIYFLMPKFQQIY